MDIRENINISLRILSLDLYYNFDLQLGWSEIASYKENKALHEYALNLQKSFINSLGTTDRHFQHPFCLINLKNIPQELIKLEMVNKIRDILLSIKMPYQEIDNLTKLMILYSLGFIDHTKYCKSIEKYSVYKFLNKDISYYLYLSRGDYIQLLYDYEQIITHENMKHNIFCENIFGSKSFPQGLKYIRLFFIEDDAVETWENL